MIVPLVLRNPAFRGAPVWGLLAGLNSGVICGLLTMAALRLHAAPSPAMLALAVWASVAAYLVLGAVTTRATEHELALPVSGRQLWIAHCAAEVSGCLAIVALSAFLIGLLARVVTVLGGAQADIPGVTALLVAASLVAVLAIEATGRGAAHASGWSFLVWRMVVIAFMALLLIVASRRPWLSSLALLLVAAAGGAFVAHCVPPALDLVPRKPGRAATPTPAATARPALPAGEARPRLAPLFFRWVPPFARYGWLVFAALLGFILAGGAGIMSSDEHAAAMRLFYFYLVAYLLVSANGPLLRPLRFADPLPVGRGRILAGLFGPPLCAVVAGALLGSLSSEIPFALTALEVALAVVIWLTSLALLLSAYRPAVPDWVRQMLYWGPLAILLIVPLRSLFSGIARRTTPFAAETGSESAVLDLVQQPAGALALVAGAGALVALAAWLALRQFRRMEIPVRAVRYEIVEWACEDR
ncbi:MAG: hypothetical protein KBD01_08215 [Acidobacteria bacterium]|nr:hypothetical protein [Acidobacteriota bacterium]